MVFKCTYQITMMSKREHYNHNGILIVIRYFETNKPLFYSLIFGGHEKTWQMPQNEKVPKE